jgi:hypothetical protein
VLTGCRAHFDALEDANLDRDSGLLPSCTGHDEDGDGFPDGCDVCPTVRDGTQRDDDGDGVGDACDPRPTIAGDYIQVLDVHTAPSTTYYLIDATYSYEGDALRLGNVTSYGAAYMDLPAVPSRLEARMRVLDASTTEHAWFGFWYHCNDPITNQVFANGNQPMGGTGSFHLKEMIDTAERFSNVLYEPGRFVAGTTYTLIVETNLVTGGDDRLTVIDDDGVRVASLRLTVAPELTAFLEVNRAMVDFDFFIAYAIR